ncbi:MAG TPA: peptide MFS transporter [Novosphingobium sp.]|nr:peptide MFS transporter [Novosphingobium sp.]
MAAATQEQQATIWGHPKGLVFLASTEMWERFSFYGMQALLTLYMVKQLLLPGFAEQVWGLAALRSLLGGGEPISDTDLAGLIAGFYSGLVYFTPIVGGWIADRLLGAKRTVLIGVLLMSAGHLAMTFDQLFLVALVLLILGSGALKGNISAQVGTLYPPAARSMRDRGFSIFSTGINIGAVSGPLVTGAVAAIWGWHAGFAVAAALMLVALVTYLAGQRHFPEAPPRRADPEAKPLTKSEKRKVWALIVVIALTMPAEITYPMIWTIGPLWIDKYVALGNVPAPWFGSADSFGSILAAAPLVALWAAQARKGQEPTSVGKIAIGTGLTGIGAMILAAGSATQTGPDTINILWPILGYFTMGLAWMYYWPTTLSLVSRVAPPAVAATMVGGAFFSPFVAHTVAGMIGTRFDNMDPAAFWAMDGAIGLAGAVLLFALKNPINRVIEARAEAD